MIAPPGILPDVVIAVLAEEPPAILFIPPTVKGPCATATASPFGALRIV